jgi:hypothetical protein
LGFDGGGIDLDDVGRTALCSSKLPSLLSSKGKSSDEEE